MQDDEENTNFNSEDISIEDLKKNLEYTNGILLENLKNRFTQDLLASMVFFVFNEVCKNKDQYTSEFSELKKENCSEIFFSAWKKHTKKQSKKEMLEINNKLKDNKMNFLSAISDFSLPSTEDYQHIYDKALQHIQKTFEKNTTFD